MSARARVYAAVAAAAVAAAGAAVGITLATRTPLPAVHKQPGAPPLSLDLGVRTDAEAGALGQAVKLYDAGKRSAAGRIFARYDSLEARVGAALASWPSRSRAQLEALARAHPRSALVQFNLGLARFWDGDDTGAALAFRAARRAQPDTVYAVEADTLLHPKFFRGLPPFTPDFPPPAGLAKLPPAGQLATLARRAAAGSVHDMLLYGVDLQGLGHPLSAERWFARAAAAAPNDPEALTAAAVGLFDKSAPAKAFSRLGPLSKRFPKAATVRYHLGLLLVWMGEAAAAKTQFAAAVRDAPASVVGQAAHRFLVGLGKVGTKPVGK